MGQFYNDKNDNFLLSNSKFIYYPLKPIQTNNNEEGGNSQPQTQGNNIETEGSMGNSSEGGPKAKVYSLDDIIDAFSNYMTLGPPNVLNYKA